MSTASYIDLELAWTLDNRNDRRFNLITAIVVSAMLGLGLVLSSINLPEEKREARRAIPPRIVNFLLEKKIAEPIKVKPPPKVRVKPKAKAKIKKSQKPKKNQKPLTKIEKKAREKAAESGLLALSNELADLMETDDISSMVGGAIKSTGSISSNNQNFQDLLLADASQGSGGVSNDQYTSVVSKTVASKREITAVRQSLVNEPVVEKSIQENKTAGQISGTRTEESLVLIFDRNKSKLYSLYNRARRINPNLKGKIILEITIAPSGKVTNIRIVSSELNDRKLESGLLRRIKGFNFGAGKVGQVTVTYPIDFLPS